MSVSDVPSPGVRRPVFPVLIVVVLLCLAIFGEKGLLRALQYTRQKEALDVEVRRLEQESAALKLEIEALRGDLRTVEGIARRELGMVKEDELVYQFRPARKEGPSGRSAAVTSAEAEESGLREEEK